MYAISLSDTLLLMAAILFFIGLICLIMGIFVLITRAMSRDVSALSAHTAKLARKGIAEDMAGLVGNASTLMTALSQMVRTAAGVGIFLTTIGLGMMASGYWIVLQVNWPI
jgi:hypothetical protein